MMKQTLITKVISPPPEDFRVIVEKTGEDYKIYLADEWGHVIRELGLGPAPGPDPIRDYLLNLEVYKPILPRKAVGEWEVYAINPPPEEIRPTTTPSSSLALDNGQVRFFGLVAFTSRVVHSRSIKKILFKLSLGGTMIDIPTGKYVICTNESGQWYWAERRLNPETFT